MGDHPGDQQNALMSTGVHVSLQLNDEALHEFKHFLGTEFQASEMMGLRTVHEASAVQPPVSHFSSVSPPFRSMDRKRSHPLIPWDPGGSAPRWVGGWAAQ